jgi:hypothetical protein
MDSPNVTLQHHLSKARPTLKAQQLDLLLSLVCSNDRVAILCVFDRDQEKMVLATASSLDLVVVKDPHSPAYLITMDGSLGLLYLQSFLTAVRQGTWHAHLVKKL